jgi:hypothetical protein
MLDRRKAVRSIGVPGWPLSNQEETNNINNNEL